MTTDQKRVCRIGELPTRFTSHDGSRVNNPRRAMALVTAAEDRSCVTTTTTTTTTHPSVAPNSNPRRLPGKLLRRETTSRLLDLSNPPTSSSNVLRATTSEPGGSSLLCKTPPQAAHRQGKPGTWKSSKFFSRTMTSADLLKGIKKLSIPNTSDDGSTPPETAKTFKTRLSSLRRKGSSGTNPAKDVLIKIDSEPDRRRESLAEFQGTTTPPRKKSEDEGIVCKREDLISLINKVAKKSAAQVSPKARRTPLRVTRSASFEPKKADSDDPDSNNSSQETSRRSSLEKNFELKEHPTSTLSLSKSNSPTNRSPLSKSSPVRIEELPSQEDIANIEEIDVKKSLLEETVSISSTDTTEGKESTDDDQPPSEAAKVQWDDGTDVNAMLLGGAIEAFLKGMGGIGAAPVTEKRVSFKKN